MTTLHYLHFPSLPSTNDWAKAHAETLDPTAWTLIVADEQTAGRGRFHRRWHSPQGTLLATYLFFQKNLQIISLPLIAGIAACHTLHHWTDQVKLKWPNDLVIDKKKLGGILCEVNETSHGWAIILGIGINIAMDQESLSTIDRPAISLQQLDLSITVCEVLDKLSNCLMEKVALYEREGFSPFLPQFQQMLIHKPGDLLHYNNFSAPLSTISGKFLCIDSEGALLLEQEDKTVLRCTTGELM